MDCLSAHRDLRVWWSTTDNARAKRSRLSDLGIGLHFGSSPPLRSRVCRGFPWNIKCNGALVDRLVVRVNKFNQHFVRTGRQTPEDERGATRVGPVPRRLVDGHMNVAHTRRDGQSTWAEHRCNAHVLRTIRITTTPREASGCGQRGVDDDLRRRLSAGERDDLRRSTPLRGALCERGARAQHQGGDDSTGATFSAACFSVIMFFTPLIASFDIRDHTDKRRPNLLDYSVGTEQDTDQHYRPID